MNLLQQALAPYASSTLNDEDLICLARLLAKIERSPESDCWLWTGRLDEHGYGAFNYKGKPRGAHRIAYALMTSQVAEDLEVDHRCRVRPCVNPRHLEPVTGEENRLRYRQALHAMVADADVPRILTTVVGLMVAAGVERMHTADILSALDASGDWPGWDAERLAAAFESAGVRRRSLQMQIDGRNRNGWHLIDLLQTN